MLSNSRFISKSGTLEHFISDHQPIYVVHKKDRDKRESVQFTGRSYRNFDQEVFKDRLLQFDWNDLYYMTSPDEAWNRIASNITLVLDTMCPIRTFHIKNYRPDWMTKELIEQIKDSDYFYSRAKRLEDSES